MKTNKKIISIILIILTIMLSINLFSCKESEANKYVKTIYDFEEYKESFEPLILANYFGKVNQNTEKQYVKTGNASAKLEPSGDYTESTFDAPTLRFPFNKQYYNNDEDISSVKAISAEIYNDSEKDIDVTLYLSLNEGLSPKKTFSLKKQSWTTVLYQLFPETMGINFNLKECKYLNLAFEEIKEGEKTPELYLDDIKLYYSEKEVNIIQMKLDENEICSFDKDYQQYVVFPTSKKGRFDPILSFNTNKLYVKSGMSLQVDYIGNDGYFNSYSYAGFNFSGNFMEKTRIKNMKEGETFTFSVYNDSIYQQRLFLILRSNQGDNNEKMFFKDANIYVKPKTWKTLTYSYEKLHETATEGLGTMNIASLEINWDIFATPQGNYRLYFDDFKILPKN